MNHSKYIKISEILALMMLNISLIISWVAYNEYQPVLVAKFGLEHLGGILIGAAEIFDSLFETGLIP